MTERTPQLQKILLKPKHQTEESLKNLGIDQDQIQQLRNVKQQYPYIELLDAKELNHLGFLIWRIENEENIRPANFESTLIKDQEYILKTEPFVFMPEFDPTQENDVITMSELLSRSAQETVNHLEKENINSIFLNNGDEEIRKVFKTYKGRTKISYNKTRSPSNRSLSLKLEELLYSEKKEPVLYTPVEGIIHLDSSRFEIRVNPDPFGKSFAENSKYENHLERGSIIDIKKSAHLGATTLAELMNLYMNNQFIDDESL